MMDLFAKWSAFLPHAEHISPTQFCAITLGDVREMIAEYQAMRARVAELEAGHDRYETLRRLNPRAFKELYDLNLKGIKPFDQLVDELRPLVRPTSSGEG